MPVRGLDDEVFSFAQIVIDHYVYILILTQGAVSSRRQLVSELI